MGEMVSIGTCGRCGGRVSVPRVWMGTIPPTPTCESCGAIPREAHGPVIPMQDGGVVTTTTQINLHPFRQPALTGGESETITFPPPPTDGRE